MTLGTWESGRHDKGNDQNTINRDFIIEPPIEKDSNSR